MKLSNLAGNYDSFTIPYGRKSTVGPSGCMRYHGTKCTLLTALFLFLSFSPPGYFSSGGGYPRVLKLCMGF